MIRRALNILSVYVLVAVVAAFGFSSIWKRPYPKYKLYEGELSFSGSNAYNDIKELVTGYPGRYFGSENGKKAAGMVKQKFKEAGLDISTQEFEGYALVDMAGRSNFGGDKKKVKGINIIGISRGKLKDTILIGAHRDTIFTVQGAEDNGSGTAAVIELASVLTRDEHKYTYLFVSFDGEETGLFGSEYFAAHNNYPVKLAVCLDMVGYNQANNISFYDFATSKGMSPVWTRALGIEILEKMGLKDCFDQMYPKGQYIPSIYFNTRVKSYINTDTRPFADRGIPTLGVKAVNDKKINTDEMVGIIHSNGDVLSQVDAKTLELAGRVTEKFVKSVEINGIMDKVYSRNYIPLSDGYIPGVIINTALMLIFMLLFVPVFINYKDMKKEGPGVPYVKGEISILIFSLFIYIVLTCIMYMLNKYTLGSSINIFIISAWYLSAIAVSAVMTLRRKKKLKTRGISMEHGNYVQKFILNVFIFLWAVLGAFITNPAAAFMLSAPFVFILANSSFKSRASRVIWRGVYMLLYLPFGIYAFNTMMPYLTIGWGIRAYLVPLWIITLWGISCIYIMSAPAIITKIKKDNSIKA